MKRYLVMILVAVLLLTGCKRETETEGEAGRINLMKTVPKQTSTLVLLNLRKLNEAVGNEENAGAVELGPQVKECLSHCGPDGEKLKEIVTSGKAGVIFSNAAMFEHKGKWVATFYVRDGKAFADCVAEELGEKFEETSGIRLSESGKVFVKENQVWLTDSGEDLTPDAIKEFTELKEQESFLALEISESMAKSEDAVCLCADMEGLSGIMGKNGFMLTTAMAMLFDDARYITSGINFDEGKMVQTINVLTAKFKPAPLLVGLNPVDMEAVRNFKGKGNLFVVLSPDSKSISGLLDQFSSFGGLDPVGEGLLRLIDGTVVMSLDADVATLGAPSLDVLVSKTAGGGTLLDEIAGRLRSQSGGVLNVSTENGQLYISTGSDAGVSLSAFSGRFSGSLGGFVMDIQAVKSAQRISEYIKSLSLIINPEGESVSMKLTIDTKPGEKSLVSLLQAMETISDEGADAEVKSPSMEQFYEDDDEELIGNFTL